jgi:tetratricopeptide (TPR) repeat protein
MDSLMAIFEIRLRFLLSFVLLGLILSGCATNGESSDTSRNLARVKEAKPKSQQEYLSEASSKLQELIVAAKKAGKDKVKYLSGDLFLKANASAMQGDNVTANMIYKNLVELIPNDDFVNKKYAVSLIRTGDLTTSKTLLENVFMNSSYEDNQTGLLLAGIFASLGKTAESTDIYKKLLVKNPKNEEACVFLGKAYALEDKISKAIDTLSKCEKSMPGKGIFSYYIGKIYVDKGLLNKAKIYFSKSLKKQPSFSQAVVALGVVHEEQKRNKAAISIYKKHLNHFPNDPIVLNRIVQVYFSNEQFKQVIPYAEKLSDFEPDNLNLKVKLGILYTDVKNYDLAISTFKGLLRHVPKNDKILYYLGAIYQETAEYESAIEHFTMIEPESGLYQDSSVQVAQMLSSLAKNEREQDTKERLKRRFITFIDGKIKEELPLRVEFSVLKASFLESQLNFIDSIAALEPVQKMENFSENHKYYLASLYDKVSEFKKAESLVLEIVKKNPQNAHAWNFLGYSLIERKVDMDKAFSYISKALKINPNDGFIRDSLGWYYYKIGKLDQALDELLKAIKIEPKDVSIQKHLAIIYSEKREFSKARAHIVEAIRYSKEKKEIQELNDALKSIESKRLPASFK